MNIGLLPHESKIYERLRDNRNTLVLVRGISGSGKSTLAKRIAEQFVFSSHYEADMFFNIKGVYHFDATKLGKAHAWCQNMVTAALQHQDVVVVSNTLTTISEINDYLKIAKEMDCSVVIYECSGEFTNVHGVPEEALAKMKSRFVCAPIVAAHVEEFLS